MTHIYLWIFLIILGIIIIIISSSKEKYTSNTSGNDAYVNIWNREMFVSACDIKINYLVAYHTITKFPYYEHVVNIILDGEPMDLTNVNANMIITTKKERLPKVPMPQIYVPYFVWAFIEKKMQPEILIKSPEETLYKNKFCCFMYSNCDDRMDGVKNRRLFLELMNKMTNNRVDNLGKCYNDKFKVNGSWVSNDKIYAPYKFVIAFENQQIRGYITEKLIMPMVARAIPIYLGASDVGEYFNTKSFINVNDFPDFETCINYVLEVDRNVQLYNSILREPYLHDNKIDRDIFSVYYGGKFYHELYKALERYGLKNFIRPCKYYINNIRFITFADEKKYKSDRVFKEAVNSGFFKETISFDPEDFDDTFRRQHSEFIRKNERGYGYWLWKPYIILKNLQSLNFGDFLIWSDSGNTVNPQGYQKIKEYYSLLEKYDMISFRIKTNELDWNKMDTVNAVIQASHNTPININTNQRTAAIILIKKTPNTMNFVQLWYRLGCNYHLIDDTPSVAPNSSGFQEHRHDQSIYSLLSKFNQNCVCLDDNYLDSKEGYKTYDGQPNPFIVSRKKR